MRFVRRLVRVLGWIVGALVVLVGVLWLVLRHSMPETKEGPAADELARAIQRSVDSDAWARTGAVRWKFARNHHLWDRRRNLDRVRFGEYEVLLDIGRRDGRAFKGGQPVEGDAARALVEKAYAAWINDSFWLNPIPKYFDDGVTRSVAEVGGRPALLVQYGKGGLTPGDRYLWLTGDGDRPRAWRLWVSVIPIKGIEISWEGWTTLATGAAIATEHRALGFNMGPISELAGAATLGELEPGPDPFR
ncbi:MAG TPA: hypothetical protein VFF06_12285 [Polyangia bacterium]|nr:hypothetical protein [Polyangia bacterium]